MYIYYTLPIYIMIMIIIIKVYSSIRTNKFTSNIHYAHKKR